MKSSLGHCTRKNSPHNIDLQSRNVEYESPRSIKERVGTPRSTAEGNSLKGFEGYILKKLSTQFPHYRERTKIEERGKSEKTAFAVKKNWENAEEDNEFFEPEEYDLFEELSSNKTLSIEDIRLLVKAQKQREFGENLQIVPEQHLPQWVDLNANDVLQHHNASSEKKKETNVHYNNFIVREELCLSKSKPDSISRDQSFPKNDDLRFSREKDNPNNEHVKNVKPKKKKRDPSDIHSYMKYKSRHRAKKRRRLEFEKIEGQVIKEETHPRLGQLEEFRRDQRRRLMAEIVCQSRDSALNVRDSDDEYTKYWENMKPENISWKSFLSMSKEVDKPQFTSWALGNGKAEKLNERIVDALTPEKSFTEISSERLLPLSTISDAKTSSNDDNDNPDPSLHYSTHLTGNTLSNESQSLDSIIDPISQDKFTDGIPLTEILQLDPRIPSPTSLDQHELVHIDQPLIQMNSILKVRNWLKGSRGFVNPHALLNEDDNVEISSQSINSTEGYISSEELSSDLEASTIHNSKTLLSILKKIRKAKRIINTRDKVSMERYKKTLDVTQKIVDDLIERQKEIMERDKKIKNNKQIFNELLDTITGRNARETIDTLGQSLDSLSLSDSEAAYESLDDLLKKLKKANEGLNRVEGQLTQKEKRLQTALEVAQDLVDKRLNLLNWERRLKKQEKDVNDMVDRINRNKSDANPVICDEVIVSIDDDDEQEFRDRELSWNPSQSLARTFTELDWEKLIIRAESECSISSKNSVLPKE
ncbi:17055_t:CDS:2 [Acaulospora morrowiae]|uniref:17055_t:CDS:1 n=1 Tax=Acaulospora morrowiae TaxID=94023 RepID=A0A9N8WEE7_9GLOM|nr:17055_t:CDS:2 [Acaulospora morrowiae]